MPSSTLLPNAPLAEVVFEMHWELDGDSNFPPPLRVDPGYGLLADTFTMEARKLGFPTHRDIVPLSQLTGYSVARRFYVDAEREFPLLQIGPGIFAANQSSGYEWDKYKKFILKGTKAFLNSYPIMREFKLKPTFFELRYIDSFDKTLIGTIDFLEFAEKGTSLKFDVPEFLHNKNLFKKIQSGRFRCSYELKGKKDTFFWLDYASGQQAGEGMIRLESKVNTTFNKPRSVSQSKQFLTRLGNWLEEAHDITSPFFVEFVRAEIMEKFS